MLISQYTLDDSNPLASVTHERDLDEFLANAALADADFTTGQSNLHRVRRRLIRKKGRRLELSPQALGMECPRTLFCYREQRREKLRRNSFNYNLD